MLPAFPAVALCASPSGTASAICSLQASEGDAPRCDGIDVPTWTQMTYENEHTQSTSTGNREKNTIL
jgi:hypothetical protein